uniref:Peptidase S1 domain-containing protein n=1 Tax=Rhabditophanes sp. KR3021 TaxID=114890 RepID=A0AC35TRP8_9BILA
MAPIEEVLSKSVKRRECVERSPPAPLITGTRGVHESNMFLGRDPTKWYVGEDEPCLKKAAKDCDIKKYIGGDQVKAFLVARSGDCFGPKPVVQPIKLEPVKQQRIAHYSHYNS